MGHPVVGDPVYRPRRLLANLQYMLPNLPATVVTGLKSVPRQMLHAWQLGLTHPTEDKFLIFESPLPRDMTDVINLLRNANR
jgi:23S rRNA pseudouridine1911/1915/1917 synthase